MTSSGNKGTVGWSEEAGHPWYKNSSGNGHQVSLNASLSYDASLTSQMHQDWTIQEGYNRLWNESQARQYAAFTVGNRARMNSDLDELQLACERMGLPVPSIPEAACAVINGGNLSDKALNSQAKRIRRVGAPFDQLSEEIEDDYADDEEISDKSTTRSRRGSKSKGPVKRKNKRRFAWPEDLHRDFVSAIFDTGLKHASTAQILEGMSSKHARLSGDTVKYHLRKYKGKREEARTTFLSSYEAGQAKEKPDSLSGPSPGVEVKPPKEPANPTEHGLLSLPTLTVEEANSHLGKSLGYLLGLLVTLEQQVVAQRAAAQLSMNHPELSSVGAALSEMHEARQKLQQRRNDTGTDTTVPSTTPGDENREDAPAEDDMEVVVESIIEEDQAIEDAPGQETDTTREPIADDDDVSNIGDEMDDERMFSFMKAL